MKQGWEIKKLGEVATFQRGLTYSKEDEVEFSCNGVLRSNNIDLNTMSLVFDELKYVREDLVIGADKKLSKGGILICMSNGSKQHLGKVAFIDKDYDYAFGGFMGLIKPNDDICAKYVYYTCISPSYKHFLAGVGCGANITNLKFADLAQHPVPIPAREEQERIVGELDCLSGIIAAKREQLRELDTLAQSIFYTMFGDPITNDKGWEIVEMDKLYDIGSSKRVFEAQWTDNGVPFYRAREIVRLSKNEQIESPIFISESLYKEYAKKYGVPTDGDMMVTAVGTLGICYIVKSTDIFYFKDGNILWFKSKGLCETQFIKDQYATSFVTDQIRGNANAAVVGTYTITNAKKTKVVMPPIDLQKEYVKKIENIERQKELITKSIAETEDLFNSRMDYYFN